MHWAWSTSGSLRKKLRQGRREKAAFSLETRSFHRLLSRVQRLQELDTLDGDVPALLDEVALEPAGLRGREHPRPVDRVLADGERVTAASSTAATPAAAPALGRRCGLFGGGLDGRKSGSRGHHPLRRVDALQMR